MRFVVVPIELVHAAIHEIIFRHTTVVDDEPAVQQALLRAFTLERYSVELAGDGLAALDVLAAGDAARYAARFARLASEARQLMLPGEMGERFKVMAWLRGMDLELRGMALVDLRGSL